MLINFDYDGVIVDSFNQLLDIARRAQALVGRGRAPIPADFQTMENLAFDDLGRRIGLAEDMISDYTRRIFELQQKHWEVEMFPGMASVFEALAAEHTLVVITSSQSDAVAETLKNFGLGAVFSGVRGGELGTSKAERITAAREAYSFACDETLMVGDAISDVREGKRAGVRTVAVAWGYQDRQLLENESPDFMANKPFDLIPIVADALIRPNRR